MILRASVVVTMSGEALRGGDVRVRGDRIVEVRERGQISAPGEQIIDLGDCALLPGLINAHCHLDYTCLRNKIPPQNAFSDWIRAINAEKAKLGPADYLRSIAEGFREAKRFGTTSLVNLEAFSELIPLVEQTALRTWWCPELIDVSAPDRTWAIVAGALDALTARRQENGGFGLAPHALFTASAELYRRCQQLRRDHDFLLTTHLAESREEMAMFRDAEGSLFEFLQSLGRNESDCGKGTPLARFVSLLGGAQRESLTSPRSARNGEWIVAHLNELTDGDFDLLAKMPGAFSIAHCPRSHAYFGHSEFAFERLRDLGFNICLATDSLASNADLSLFAEMRAFQQRRPRVAAEQILEMVTTHPARALGQSQELGRIGPGYFADMIALPITGPPDIHEQIISFDAEVPWMMIAGRVI